jgi:hypothetical protein
MNYIKLFEDGTSEAVDVKPSWGMYEKEHALDNREVYIDGNWYTTTGGELVTNGTFDSDVSGWIGYPGRSATIVTENQRAKITSIATSGSGVYTAIPTEIGVEYTITAYMESPSVTVVLEIFTSNTCVEGGQLALPAILGAAETEYVESTFVAETAISYIGLRVATGTAGFLLYADNISVYKAEPTIDTLQPPHTYLSNKGKLAGIEVANGAPVDIHYDELAPTLVEDTIKATDIIAGEYHGKNACTAWVNFDGITTPPTIRDSFNVSDVVRTATGKFKVYFNNEMNNENYSMSGSVKYNAAVGSMGSVEILNEDEGGVSYIGIVTKFNYDDAEGYTNYSTVNVQIFGGKN